MANYTMELRSLIKSGYNIFDDSWNTFVPSHKKELCDKIIRHYWFYEIGSETADRFKFNLNEQLSLIMPYYNQLYASELLKIEPLYDRFMEEQTGETRNRKRNRGVSERRDSNILKEMAESIKRLAESDSNFTGNENIIGNEKWNENRKISTTEVTDQDTTENTTQKVEFDQTVDESKKEVMEDKVVGEKISDNTTNTTTNNTRRYSDTPQAHINESDMTIEQQYLTNYTRDNGSTNTTYHGTENINNTENKTTDTTDTTTTSSQEDTTKDIKGTNDITKTINTIDDVNGNKDKTQTTDQKEDTVSKSKEHDFSNGSEETKLNQLSYLDEKENENEGVDRKTGIKGFTVSQSELLLAYRETFINVDQMIIKELVENFMGIF